MQHTLKAEVVDHKVNQQHSFKDNISLHIVIIVLFVENKSYNQPSDAISGASQITLDQ